MFFKCFNHKKFNSLIRDAIHLIKSLNLLKAVLCYYFMNQAKYDSRACLFFQAFFPYDNVEILKWPCNVVILATINFVPNTFFLCISG